MLRIRIFYRIDTNETLGAHVLTPIEMKRIHMESGEHSEVDDSNV